MIFQARASILKVVIKALDSLNNISATSNLPANLQGFKTCHRDISALKQYFQLEPLTWNEKLAYTRASLKSNFIFSARNAFFSNLGTTLSDSFTAVWFLFFSAARALTADKRFKSLSLWITVSSLWTQNTWFAMAHTCFVSLFIVLAIVWSLLSCELFNQAWIHKKALHITFSLKKRPLKRRAAKRVNRQNHKKEYLFRTTKIDCLTFSISVPIFKTWSFS